MWRSSGAGLFQLLHLYSPILCRYVIASICMLLVLLCTARQSLCWLCQSAISGAAPAILHSQWYVAIQGSTRNWCFWWPFFLQKLGILMYFEWRYWLLINLGANNSYGPYINATVSPLPLRTKLLSPSYILFLFFSIFQSSKSTINQFDFDNFWLPIEIGSFILSTNSILKFWNLYNWIMERF